MVPFYDFAAPCPNGLHRIELAGKHSYIDDSGNVVMEAPTGYCLDDEFAEKALHKFHSRK
ncbi:MAG: hypothetical protein L0387_43895 [Acidobacteria bacterium]|nr:hypothetical protein [Acidobacteriota bacterium]MCI0722158.1 hypothetical protein [Acidobacteriota bacterium]